MEGKTNGCIEKFEIVEDEGKVIIHFNPNSEELSKTGKSIMLGSSKGFKWEGNIGLTFNVIRKL